jgi:protein-S-isoprenylcysteine O-methyltransferase Ste14
MLTAIHALFNHPTLRRIFLKSRYLLAVALVALIAHYAQPRLLVAGFLVSLFGQAIQLWSFGSLVKNQQLTARGPYVLVRNPMYLGRFFLILGFVLIVCNVWAVVAYTAFYYFYMVNRVRREEVRLEQLLGEPYRVYRASVNRFLPNFGKLGDPMVRFLDFTVLRRNNGHWNLLATLIGWATLYLYLSYLR